MSKLIDEIAENWADRYTDDSSVYSYTAMREVIKSALTEYEAARTKGAEKWCSYCKTNTHNDAECWSTRPMNHKPEPGFVWTPDILKEASKVAGEDAELLYLCCASGEGTQDFRVCTTQDAVDEFYKEMFGNDQDGTINSHKEHFGDSDNWNNEGTHYHVDLYCCSFEVWKVTPKEIENPRTADRLATLSAEVERLKEKP